MANNTLDIGAIQSGGSNNKALDIGAVQAVPVVPSVGGIMTTNTGYWGALIILLGLLLLTGIPF